MSGEQNRRNRGVILSASGLQRLNQAIGAVEQLENAGNRFSMAALSDRTGISTSTLSRLWAAKLGVDRRTLLLLFSAFKLTLLDSDLQQGDLQQRDLQPEEANFNIVGTTDLASLAVSGVSSGEIRYPSGPVPVGSDRYVSRPGIDDRAVQEVMQPGCVIRVKAPCGFGKTSLVLRIVDQAEQQGYAVARIDLQQAETETLADTTAFLRWFCSALSIKLGLDLKLDDYWGLGLGSKLSTTLYVREYLLVQLNRPLVLALNEVNRLFEHRTTAQNVLPLLRSWHEDAQHDGIWKRLRLIVIYSTDVYLPLDINQSPFNVGLPLLLPEFTRQQVQTLADSYSVSWSEAEGDRLFELIGGNPSLVNIALYHLQTGMSLDHLLQTASTQEGVFRNHLQRLRSQLERNPGWLKALEPLLAGETSIFLDSTLAYQLEGLGLIQPLANGWQLRCRLYQAFLQPDRL